MTIQRFFRDKASPRVKRACLQNDILIDLAFTMHEEKNYAASMSLILTALDLNKANNNFYGLPTRTFDAENLAIAGIYNALKQCNDGIKLASIASRYKQIAFRMHDLPSIAQLRELDIAKYFRQREKAEMQKEMMIGMFLKMMEHDSFLMRMSPKCTLPQRRMAG